MLGGQLWRAVGERGKGKRAKRFSLTVRATTEEKALRAGKFYLKAVHRAKCTHVIRLDDEDKRAMLREIINNPYTRTADVCEIYGREGQGCTI